MRDFVAAGQHNLSPDFAALIGATVIFSYGYFCHCRAALQARDPAIHTGASVARMERSAMRDFTAARQYNLSPDFAALIRATVAFVIAGPPRSGVTRQSMRQCRACGSLVWTAGSGPAVTRMKLPVVIVDRPCGYSILPHLRAGADRRPSSHHARRSSPSHSRSAR